MTLQRLAALLQDLDLEPEEEDILDVLWLARYLPGTPPAQPDEKAPQVIPGEGRNASGDAGRPPGAGRVHEALGSAARYSLHTRQVSRSGSGGKRAIGVRAPAAPAIGGQLDVARALRPLTRKAPSRIHQFLDEETTAHRVADQRLWLPAMKPTPTRWLELALVVDGYESMSIWRQSIADLRSMLENLGAFADVRFWILERAAHGPHGVGVRRRQPGSALRSPRELIDPAGRRVILLVSDCLGPIWQSRAAQQTLGLWARRGPVAIIQPLPQRLWNHSYARVTRARLQAFQPGVANAQLGCRLTATGSMAAGTNGVPVPVLELDAAWLASWTRLLVASGESGVDAMVLFTASPTPAAPEHPEGDRRPLTAFQRIERFRATASPGAVRLAEFMSAAPVSLPVIRLVQQVTLGAPSQSQVAEMVLGGLLYRSGGGDADPDLVQYEFFPDVREILQGRLKRSDALRILQKVSDFVGLRFGQARDFRALLAGADISGDFALSQGSMPFAQVATQVLRSLGGVHAQSAERLAALIAGTDESAAAAGPSRLPDGTGMARPPLSTGTVAGTSDEQFAADLARVRISDQRSRHTPLVCPYCYHAFAERSILFRCEGRAGAGRNACPRSVDAVLQREMGNSALLPPVFSADGRKAEAVCPDCRGSTRDQVCPGCHSSLPANFGGGQGRLIALVGPSEAGKTAFMAVLIHELQHRVGALLNSSTTGADDTTQERFRHYCEAPIYGQMLLPGRTTTAGSNYIAPLVYRFTMNQRTRFRAQSHELILSFADSAGEDLASASKIEFMARYMAAADAVIVLVDPLQFEQVRDRLAPGTPVPSRVTREQDPRVAFDRITRLLHASAGDQLIQKPVAIVLSKIDVLWQFLPSDSLLRTEKPPLSYFDATDHVAVQEQVRALLADWGAADIDRLVRERYARAQYFALSALGVTPSAENRIPAPGIQPYRATEPFMWLLTQFGLARSE